VQTRRREHLPNTANTVPLPIFSASSSLQRHKYYQEFLPTDDSRSTTEELDPNRASRKLLWVH